MDWQETLVIDAGCDAPEICESDGQVYLAGCCAAAGQGKPGPDGKRPFDVLNTFSHPEILLARWGTTGLYLLTRDRVELLVTLPPGGDAAYPGLVSPEPGKLVMSTYSDVAYISGQVRSMHFPKYQYKQTDCDIYIAEIEVGQAE